MIGALRDTLAADLAATGVAVHPAYPDRLSAPCVVVCPPSSGSYVTAGPQFGGTYTVSLDLALLVDRGTPAVALAELELLIEAVLVNTADWSLSGVDAPTTTTVGGSELLGTVIHVSKADRLT